MTHRTVYRVIRSESVDSRRIRAFAHSSQAREARLQRIKQHRERVGIEIEKLSQQAWRAAGLRVNQAGSS
jgi:hypothetical protein